MLVWSVIEACGGNFGCKPVGFGKANGERDEVLLYLLLGELVTDFVEGFDGLASSAYDLR